MDIGRRAQYRVELDEAAGLRVTIPNPKGRPFVGRLLDVSADGAGARFQAPEFPELAVGQEVNLIMTSDRLKSSLKVAARVQHRAEEEGFRRYGFRFLRREQLEAQLSPALRQLFNRRKAVRVSPDTRSSVPTALEAAPGGPSAKARLEDLSALGAGVSLEAEAEAVFATTTRVGISLSLPGCRDPVDLVGHIRYRRLVGARIHYGIEFDAALSRHFEQQQEAITEYVMQRQRRMLKRPVR
ncbi:MAG: PilZ domain-containing protein [Planctomycetota bacterium]|jgi:c-di-GMP-binding flagellar brake protein YcgR